MSFEALKAQAIGKLEFFAPAPPEQLEQLQRAYPDFDLTEYVALLRHSNGTGEILSEGSHRFIHNMLLFEVEQAMQESRASGPSFLVIGTPGVDGHLYGLQPGSPLVYEYEPIDQEFNPIAENAQNLLAKWLSNEL